MIVAWKVMADDSEDGRAPLTLVGYFTRKDDAEMAAAKRGCQGMSDGDIQRIILFESFEEYGNDHQQKLRASGIAKLSTDERIALGLIDAATTSTGIGGRPRGM